MHFNQMRITAWNLSRTLMGTETPMTAVRRISSEPVKVSETSRRPNKPTKNAPPTAEPTANLGTNLIRFALLIWEDESGQNKSNERVRLADPSSRLRASRRRRQPCPQVPAMPRL